MPGPVRTRNERLIVEDPPSKSELRQRERIAVFCVGKDLAELTRGDVKSWARPLQKAAAVNFELQPIRPPSGWLCGAPGCGNACG